MKDFHLHLVSDSTGDTVAMVARACLVQFDDIKATQHVWTMVRNKARLKEVIAGIENHHGLVLYTLFAPELRNLLEDTCHQLQVSCISILDPLVAAMGAFLETQPRIRTGRKHVMDAEYFSRIEAMQFALIHDDGQAVWNSDEADVVVLGVSRTSKTPTCIYLANRGIKAANVPIVRGVSLPREVIESTQPLVVGLTHDPRHLVDIRSNRLRMMGDTEVAGYNDIERVTEEITEARRLFAKHGWPVIDSTRRSIEEVAATIVQLHHRRLEQRK
jgi:[pyruvate, water dikinase]-phosphate phosphotransferase / [pyruvate, water dikinase] kinase